MDGLGCWRLLELAMSDDYCTDTGSAGLRGVSKSTAWVKYKVIFTFNRHGPQAKTKVLRCQSSSRCFERTWTGIRIFRISPFYMSLSCSWNSRKLDLPNVSLKNWAFFRVLYDSVEFSFWFIISRLDTFTLFLSFSESIFICRKSMNLHSIFGLSWVGSHWTLYTSLVGDTRAALVPAVSADCELINPIKIENVNSSSIWTCTGSFCGLCTTLAGSRVCGKKGYR